MTHPAIVVEGVTKRFGGVRALTDFNLRVDKGTIHAIVGENGAGKSTFMNVLSGIIRRDSGRVLLDNKDVNFENPQQSQKAGVGIVHQELALSPDLSVAENIFLDDLGRGGRTINWNAMNARASELLKSFGFPINPRKRTGDLSVAYQQMVEITKSLAKDVNILILDEPTAVLTDPEIELLFENLHRLKAKGVTILYISHRLEEIFRIADGITVIKDGATVCDLDPKTCTENDIIQAMVGRELKSLFPEKNTPQDEVLVEVRNLTRRGLISDINLNIRKGEIVGLAGLVGSGRTEVAECLFGLASYQKGEIIKSGNPVKVSHPADAVAQGIGLVPESRKEQGVVLPMGIDVNMTMSRLSGVSKMGVLQGSREKTLTQRLREQLRIKLGRLSDPVSSLSGGNQQKVVLAKWLNVGCDFLIFDEPTRGVDVGAKSEIYNLISALAKDGCGLLVISSELPEVIGLCHRVYVMADGHIAGELQSNELTEEQIMHHAIPKRIVQ